MEGGLKATCSKEERDKADFFVKVTDVPTYLICKRSWKEPSVLPSACRQLGFTSEPHSRGRKITVLSQGLARSAVGKDGGGAVGGKPGRERPECGKGKGSLRDIFTLQSGWRLWDKKKKKKSVQAAVRAGEKEGEHGLSEGHDCEPIESLLSLLLQTG